MPQTLVGKVGGADPGKRASVVVTRPVHDAQQWVTQLRQAGFKATALPLIVIAPSSSPDDAHVLQQAWRNIADFAACMFVSGNAVEHFFRPNRLDVLDERLDVAINKVATANWQEVNPALRFLAPGPGTAAALLANGVPAGQIDSPPPDATQFDSEALWHVVGRRDWRGCRVLIVRGSSSGDSDLSGTSAGAGRDWIARQWRAAGAEVSFVSVYERRPPVFTLAQIEAVRLASADGTVWLFSSSEAVSSLTRQRGLEAMDWSHARAVATHPRILEAVRSAGWGVALESRPALKDILATLRSIESGHPSVYP